MTRSRNSASAQRAIAQECSKSSAQGFRKKGQGIYMTRMRQIVDGGDKECDCGSGFPQIAHSIAETTKEVESMGDQGEGTARDSDCLYPRRGLLSAQRKCFHKMDEKGSPPL